MRTIMKSAVTCYMIALVLCLMGVNDAYTTEQKSWSVSFSDMKGGTNKTGGTIVTADGAEYKFQVTGSIPDGVTFKWEVLPNAGILSGETGKTLTYQSPISHEENTSVKVTAIFPPGGAGGEPYWADWSVTIKEAFVDAYLYEGNRNNNEAYALAKDPASTKTVYALIGDGNTEDKPGTGIKVVPVHWAETHSGDAGTLSANQTDTDDAGEAQVVLTTSKQAAHYHNVTATIKDKDGAESNANASPKINVIKVEVKEISFGSSGEHTMKKTGSDVWGNDTYASDGDTNITDPVWTNAGKDDPICYTKSSSPVLTVKLGITPSISNVSAILKVDEVNPPPTGVLNYEKNITLTGTEITVSGLTSNGFLTSKVENTMLSFDWKISFDGGNSYSLMASTDHILFQTWSTPTGTTKTAKRVDWSTWKADLATSDSAAADGIHNGLGNVDPPYEPGEKPTLGNSWTLLDGGTYGECDEQAGLMEDGVEMLGISASTADVRASSNSGAGNCLDQESKIEESIKKWLILDFNTGAGYNWNAFEGCCVTTGSYYAIWPKHKATNDYDMLKNKLSCQQYWVKTYNDIQPGQSGWNVETVYDEEPKP